MGVSHQLGNVSMEEDVLNSGKHATEQAGGMVKSRIIPHGKDEKDRPDN